MRAPIPLSLILLVLGVALLIWQLNNGTSIVMFMIMEGCFLSTSIIWVLFFMDEEEAGKAVRAGFAGLVAFGATFVILWK